MAQHLTSRMTESDRQMLAVASSGRSSEKPRQTEERDFSLSTFGLFCFNFLTSDHLSLILPAF